MPDIEGLKSCFSSLVFMFIVNKSSLHLHNQRNMPWKQRKDWRWFLLYLFWFAYGELFASSFTLQEDLMTLTQHGRKPFCISREWVTVAKALPTSCCFVFSLKNSELIYKGLPVASSSNARNNQALHHHHRLKKHAHISKQWSMKILTF